MPTITFQPSGVTIEVKPGTTVFHAAERAEVPIPSQCGGKCACALCRVCVLTADPAVSPMEWEEEGHLGNAFFVTRERLSCRLQVFDDITVEVAAAPTKDKKAARYIPYSIVRKREQMEREDDQRRAAGSTPGGRPKRPKRRPDGPSKKPKRRRRGRSSEKKPTDP